MQRKRRSGLQAPNRFGSVVLAAMVLVAGMSCAHGVRRPGVDDCLPVDGFNGALQRLSVMDWTLVTPTTITGFWPTALASGEFFESPEHTPCSSSMAMRHSERIIEDDCLCCQTLIFDQQVRGASCAEYLHQVIIQRSFPSFADAKEAEDRLRSLLASTAPAPNERRSSASYTWTDDHNRWWVLETDISRTSELWVLYAAWTQHPPIATE